MKKKMIFLAILTLLFLPKEINAECSYEKKAYYKKFASNINVSYDFEEVENTAAFKITFTNVPKDYFLVGSGYLGIYTSTGEEAFSDVVIDNLAGGKTYSVNVYAGNSECPNELLNTIYISLPYYNAFYKDPVCNGLSGYDLCNRWYQHSLSYEEFVAKVKKYKETSKQDEPVSEKPQASWLDYYLQYYYIVLPIIVVVGGAIIYIYNKKERFF